MKEEYRSSSAALQQFRIGSEDTDSRKVTFEEELERSGRLVYTNVGRSMEPLIREGRDIMVIERLDQPPKKLDAVLFRRPWIKGRGAYVMHRIVALNPDGTYRIAGDNCTYFEDVAQENILGALTSVRRGKRTVKTTDLGYRLYVALWCSPYRLRIKCLKLKKRVFRFSRRVRRRLFHTENE